MLKKFANRGDLLSYFFDIGEPEEFNDKGEAV